MIQCWRWYGYFCQAGWGFLSPACAAFPAVHNKVIVIGFRAICCDYPIAQLHIAQLCSYYLSLFVIYCKSDLNPDAVHSHVQRNPAAKQHVALKSESYSVMLSCQTKIKLQMGPTRHGLNRKQNKQEIWRAMHSHWHVIQPFKWLMVAHFQKVTNVSHLPTCILCDFRHL